MWMTKINVSSFRWMSSFTVVTNIQQGDKIYIAQQKIADNAVLLTYMNITLWNNGGNTTIFWNETLQWTTQQKALQIAKYLNNIRSQDILSLATSDTDGKNLDTHTQQWKVLMTHANNLIWPLSSLIKEYEDQTSSCTNQKKQSDNQYNEALQSYNSILVEQSTTRSKDASICIGTNSVSMNSVKWVLGTLQSDMTKTQKYLDLITKNRTLLIQYGVMLPTEIPAQLVQLQKDLRNL